MSEAANYYKRSGALSFSGLIIMGLLAVPTALILGVAYGLAVYFVPLVKISFLITLAAGAAIGFALGGLGTVGKMRSMGVLFAVSLFAGVLTWYVSWISWIFAMSEYQALIIDPRYLFEVMTVGFHEGFWSMGSSGEPMTGYPLVLVWVIEAGLIIGMAILIPRSMLADRLFCEPCNAWVRGVTKFSHREAMEDPSAIKSALESGDYEALAALGPQLSSEHPYTDVEIHCCEQCRELGYLQVKAAVQVEGKNGIEVKSTDIVKHLIVPPAVSDFLNRRWAVDNVAPQQASEEAPAAE